MKNITISPAIKSIIKNNWKSKNNSSSELVIYLLLTRKKAIEVIEKSFLFSKNKNSYKKTSLIQALLNLNIDSSLSFLLKDCEYNNIQIKYIKDYVNFNITHLLLDHLGKINIDPIYKTSRNNFKNYWKINAKNKNIDNVSFLMFTLLNKNNIWGNLKKAFPQVTNKNKQYYYAYNESTTYAGLMKTLDNCRNLPLKYNRVLGYNMRKAILMKVLSNLYSTLTYEEKK